MRITVKNSKITKGSQKEKIIIDKTPMQTESEGVNKKQNGKKRKLALASLKPQRIRKKTKSNSTVNIDIVKDKLPCI